ncbi:DNA-binding domain-containing protein [Pseudomonas entomophila]|uniref:conjugal transfer nickase/helicase domain-containing protein n=1 Tax=Pseudomonas entomophila TaxID=312306 RepID=UPI0023D8677E|nr:DNA-binding domain-containing protein [Pseudomonas entomophila]MDF0730620.1 DNA-binding domain-containing protein [Pseudomonas entomophila]
MSQALPKLNDTKTLIHTVDDTAMLVTPGIFKRYVLEHPELERTFDKTGTAAWQHVQRAFEKEQSHPKTGKQLNIRTYDAIGPRKTAQLKGCLLLDPKLLRRVVEGAAG